MTANFTVVASKYCPGNRKGVVGLVGVGESDGDVNVKVEGK